MWGGEESLLYGKIIPGILNILIQQIKKQKFRKKSLESFHHPKYHKTSQKSQKERLIISIASNSKFMYSKTHQ